MRASLFLLVALLLARPARAADRLTILLDWFVNPDHAALVIAQTSGAFARHGLDVTLVPPADPSLPPRLVAAGHGDVAIGYQAQLYQQVQNGLGVMRIGTLIDHPLATLETLQSANIRGIADLRGKRIGTSTVGGDIDLAMIARMLSTAHLTLADVHLVDIGTALTTALLTHRVDAVGVYRNFEHFALLAQGATPRDFDYEAYGVPLHDELILLVRPAMRTDPRLPRLLAALREATAAIRADPQASWRQFVAAYPDLDDALNHQSWLATTPLLATDPAHLDAARYRDFATFLIAAHAIGPTLPPLQSYAVQLP